VEFDKGAQGARALLTLIGAPGRQTKAAARPETASPEASDDYQRGAAEARRLLGIRAEPSGAGGDASSPGSAAGREKGAAEARRLLGIEIADA
jgi:hypothetical protein